MPIKVCDAIMGSGKTSAIISMMNSNPRNKYLYITPLLSEADRIVENCPALQFVSPSNKISQFGFKKQTHLQELIREGNNIAITHALFTGSTQETLSLIKETGYTIIIDEAVDVFKQANVTNSDYELVKAAGLIVEDEHNKNTYTVSDNSYSSGKLQEFFVLARSNRLVHLQGDTKSIYYWSLAKELFEISEEIYILTYMFHSQTLRWYFDLNEIKYEYIYINKDRDGHYSFTDSLTYMPAYVSHLSDMIHIFENEKLNEIGNNKTALSSSWYDRALKNKDNGKMDRLKKNLANFFTNYNRNIPASSRMWSSYKKGTGAIRTKGFYNSNLEYNCKATNIYSDKRVLAYCVNIFLHPQEKTYFLQNQIEIDEDAQALATMLQWIWRSAIRNGQEIWIYVPSKRMRNLLKKWIKETQQLYYRINQSKEA